MGLSPLTGLAASMAAQTRNPLAELMDPGTFGLPGQLGMQPTLPPGLADEDESGLSPMLGAMLQSSGAGAYAPPPSPMPELSSYGPDPAAAPDPSKVLIPGWNDPPEVDPELLEPVRREPSQRERILRAILPLLAGAVAGGIGGSAAATGALAGFNKAHGDNAALDLERSKIDAARRERALTRQQQNEQRVWERNAKQQDVLKDLFSQANNFNDPASLNRWLETMRPYYAKWGIDTVEFKNVVAPGAEKRAQDEAAKRYDAIVKTHVDTKGKDKDFDLDKFHDSTYVDWNGAHITLRDFARVAGRGVSQDAYEDNFAGSGTVADYVRGMAEAFETKSGRPPSRPERNKMTLEAEKALAEAKRDPMSQRVKEAQLRHYADLAAERARKRAGGGADKGYTTAQETVIRALNSQYVAASKDFDTRARAYDNLTATADRAPGNAVAQLSLIFAYMKMIDPRSVVREKEQEQVGDTTNIPQRVMNWYNQVVKGQGGLSETQIKQIRGEAQGLYGRFKQAHDRTVRTFSQRAMRRNIDPYDVVIDYNAADDDMVIPNAAAPEEMEQTPDGVIRPVAKRPASAAPAPAFDFAAANRTTVPGVGTQAKPSGLPAQRPTSTQTQVQAGAPKRVVKGQTIIYNGKPRTVARVNPDGVSGIELVPE